MTHSDCEEHTHKSRCLLNILLSTVVCYGVLILLPSLLLLNWSLSDVLSSSFLCESIHRFYIYFLRKTFEFSHSVHTENDMILFEIPLWRKMFDQFINQNKYVSVQLNSFFNVHILTKRNTPQCICKTCTISRLFFLVMLVC